MTNYQNWCILAIVSLKEITFETSKFKDYKCEIQIRTILQDAWAQIFHDRQYKGILNDVCYSYEIKRKTSLIAGALELIDNQITDLVSEYDSLNDVLLDGVRFRELLDEEINATTVAAYCKTKSKGQITRYYNTEATISQLKAYNLTYVRDLDNIVQNQFINAVVEINQITIDKLISYILIIADDKKYFSLSTGNTIKSISKESFDLLNKFVNMEQICVDQQITINEM